MSQVTNYSIILNVSLNPKNILRKSTKKFLQRHQQTQSMKRFNINHFAKQILEVDMMIKVSNFGDIKNLKKVGGGNFSKVYKHVIGTDEVACKQIKMDW